MTGPDDFFIEPSIAVPAAADDSGPSLSSNAPGPVEEPHDQPGSEQEQPNQDPFAPREFNEKYKEPFTGLLFLGFLEQTVSIWGHTFRLVTPSQMEKIQAGQLHKDYADTLASEIAYQTILVASYLTEVDHRELPKPVVMDPKENAVRDRFRWVADNLRGPVIDRLFSECLVLDGEVRATLDAMGEA